MPRKPKKPTLPMHVTLLAEAAQCEDEQGARLLVEKALEAANCKEDMFGVRKVDDVSLDAIVSLVRGINPKDTVELLLASQIVTCHLQSMVKLAGTNNSDTSHGMMLMRLSHQALETLQKYRSKGSNINVNYFVHNEGQAVLQTNIGKNLEKKGG